LPSEFFESIRVPKERIGVLIGSKGRVKRRLEKLTGTVIDVDSAEGIVEIEGKGNSANFNDAVNVVKAIGRGFSPENAFELLGEDTFLDIIDVPGIVGGGRKTAMTKKGRVIGAKGMAREQIEKATGAKISVFGKTVSIIGSGEEVELARDAIERLLQGAKHETVLSFIKKQQAEKTRFSI